MYTRLNRIFAMLVLLAMVGAFLPSHVNLANASALNGVVVVKSNYSLGQTIARIKADIATKGITFFAEIDQSGLGNEAGNKVLPSKLLLFGNPALGTTFITANPQAGLDWPVRVLVYQADNGKVFVAYNDFGWIARRHGIVTRNAQFAMATEVIRSITSTIR